MRVFFLLAISLPSPLAALPALDQVRRASESSGLASLEGASSRQSAWADGKGLSHPLAVRGELGDQRARESLLDRPSEGTGGSGSETRGFYPPTRAASPRQQDEEPPLPKNEFADELGFSAGFLAVESLAIAAAQVPYVGEPVGAVLFVILLPLALVGGAIGALIGWFLG